MADDGKKVSQLDEINSISDSDLIHVASNGSSKNSPFIKVVAYIKSKLTKSDVGLDNVDNVQQYSASNPPTKSDVGLENVDNIRQYSVDNPPPYPVLSVNGQTGNANVPTIMPPDFLNSIRTMSLTSGTLTSHVSTGKWYQVRAINRNTSGDCFVAITNETQTDYYAFAQSPSGNFVRALTEWLYIPAGITFYVRATFTYSDTSGLYECNPLT